MFMRYIGGGIGHKATNFIKQTVPEPAPEIPSNTQEDTAGLEGITGRVSTVPHPQLGEDDIDEDADLEHADSEEEADFGYGDDANDDADEDLEDEVNEDEDEVNEDEDEDDFADL